MREIRQSCSNSAEGYSIFCDIWLLCELYKYIFDSDKKPHHLSVQQEAIGLYCFLHPVPPNVGFILGCTVRRAIIRDGQLQHTTIYENKAHIP